MRVLLTGASGFLGRYIKESLANHEVTTLGTSMADIHQNIQEPFELSGDFDVLIHVAGKAHVVPKNKEEEEAFFNINHKGTQNVLNALMKDEIKKIIFISTVAVYGKEIGEGINENHKLNGTSPYALSKIYAEEAIRIWATSAKKEYIILRLPLIMGSNPPGNLASMISAMKARRYFGIGKGEARKSMVHAEDVAQLITELIEENHSSGAFNLTDSIDPQFKDVEDYIASELSVEIRRIPLFLAKFLALPGLLLSKYPLNPDRLKKMTSSLTFDDSKARKLLNWSPQPALRGKISS